MLAKIGVKKVADLFDSIPSALRLEKPLNLPAPLSESELVAAMRRMEKHNPNPDEYIQFLGAGAYRHFTPTLINHLLLRGELFTCYTPYQPEVSQGTLQAIFEFQSMICMLTGMEVANASMYDGASALAEAVLMATRVNGRQEVILSRAVHPEYRQVTKTYIHGNGIKLIEAPFLPDGKTDLAYIEKHLSDKTSAVVIQTPNFFGVVEEYAGLSKKLQERGVLLVVAVAEALSLGILKPPGERGADIVAGEGQSFGLPVSFGGPYVGFFATREKYFRQMPGRLIGETVDRQGKRAYTLTLATREQHIRREKATSNICTNQGLMVTGATLYLALLGPAGLAGVASACHASTSMLASRLTAIEGVARAFSGAFFHEMVIRLPVPVAPVLSALKAQGILGGLNLARDYPELGHALLVCATETRSEQDVALYAEHMARIIGKRLRPASCAVKPVNET